MSETPQMSTFNGFMKNFSFLNYKTEKQETKQLSVDLILYFPNLKSRVQIWASGIFTAIYCELQSLLVLTSPKALPAPSNPVLPQAV